MARQKWAYFFALLFVALALGPGLAHLLELPNKIGLAEQPYFVVQNIYRGWALLGFVVFGALAATLALSVLVRRDRRARIGALLAFFCIVGGQVLFWTFTFPANQATDNWTAVPANWEALRTQWEYSHAVNATLSLLALIALIWSVLEWRGGRGESA